jgi:anti-anti-sigma factor
MAEQSSTGHTHNSPAANVEMRGGSLTVVVTASQVGSAEAPKIQAVALPAMERMGKSLRVFVLDVSAVTYMNSMGLGVCIELRNRAHKMGAQCVIFGMQKKIAELFRLMKVDRLFEVAADAAELGRLLR